MAVSEDIVSATTTSLPPILRIGFWLTPDRLHLCDLALTAMQIVLICSDINSSPALQRTLFRFGVTCLVVVVAAVGIICAVSFICWVLFYT